MRVSDVRKKYPEFFATVEAAVWDDSLSIDNSHILLPYAVCNKVRKRLAYNAAAVATLELHKIMVASRKNIVTKPKKRKR